MQKICKRYNYKIRSVYYFNFKWNIYNTKSYFAGLTIVILIATIIGVINDYKEILNKNMF